MIKADAKLIFYGMGDYWSGDGQRWDDDAGCLFHTYGRSDTISDVVNRWVEDWLSGGDFDGKPMADRVSDAEIRRALRAVFVDDVDTSETFGPSEDFADANPETDDDDDYGDLPIAIIMVTLSETPDVVPAVTPGPLMDGYTQLSHPWPGARRSVSPPVVPCSGLDWSF